MTYLGSVVSDRAEYPRAIALLQGAVRASRDAGEPRRRPSAWSMLGRVSLLRGDLVEAAEILTSAGDLAQRDHWLSFLPWPQAMLGQAWLSLGVTSTPPPALPRAVVRAGLPDRRPLLGGHLRPRAGPAGRGRG